MWTTPKTNWQSSDYINKEDFNRIRNNILFLKEEATKFFGSFSFTVPISDEITSYSTYVYTAHWNSLESCLQDLINNTYELENVGEMKIFNVYDPYIDYVELNRLENACLLYHTMFEGMETIKEVLPFKLGDYKGIGV